MRGCCLLAKGAQGVRVWNPPDCEWGIEWTAEELGAKEKAFIKLRSDVKQMWHSKSDRSEARRAQFVEELKAMRFRNNGDSDVCLSCEFGCSKCLPGVPIDGINGRLLLV